MSETTLRDFKTLFSLKGKVAVITGGSRGLGLHAASAFLQAGASIVFISSRKASACESACRELNALPNLEPGARAIPIPADVAKVSGVEHLVAEVSKHTDHVDILFANAGASWGEGIDTHGDVPFSKTMDLNVKGVYNSIRLFLPLLEKSAKHEDPARIIITASTAGVSIGPPQTYGYTASKAAVIHLGRNLAAELGNRNMTVNSIAPGFFPSKMSNGLLEIMGKESFIEGNPLRRLGEPEDIAGAVVYLASRAGRYVNGDVLVIDGGAMWAREAKL